MSERESGLFSKIKATEAWKKWGRVYLQRLEVVGEEPPFRAKGVLTPIPPDTHSSLMHDLREGVDTVPFSVIVEELSPEKIAADLESYSAFGDESAPAIMHFRKRTGDEGSET